MDSENAQQVEGKARKAKRPGKLSKIKDKLKEFWRESIRVLRVTRKPDKQEFKTIVKISGFGIIIIGLLGFLIFLIKELIL